MADSAPSHPARIAHYSIEAVLGEGGMGVVYRARQTDPIDRVVALKVIKLGMDTREVVRRFEAERQALARMDHPGIAKVLDAGATDEGRPYFVMELVDGIPLNRFCDAHRLTIRERVALFVDVCRAVQHAHQRGVIHRDLKPSNVLVSRVDGEPLPRVIDFGIATATDASDRVDDLTRIDQMVGTPAYMSPEQAEGGGRDVDIRSDVYSLGVMLYELLAGALPFTERELGLRGLQLLALLTTSEPPRPSVRIARLSDTQATVAELRGTRVEVLRRTLSGELDWVVMRAMEKDRDVRYASVGDLMRDLQAFLEDRPVEARPPSALYRARKFARRNRVAVAAGSAVLAALVGGLAAATTGLVRASRAQAEAAREAASYAQVSEFLVDMFSTVDPRMSGGRPVLVREVLDNASRTIDQRLDSVPAVRTRLLASLGWIYMQVGEFEAGDALLTEAETAAEQLGPDDVRTREELTTYRGVAHQMSGRFEEAERHWLAAIDEQDRRDGAGREEYTARLLLNLGRLYLETSRWPQADSVLEAGERLLRASGEVDPVALAVLLQNKAMAALRQGRVQEAEVLLGEVLTIREEILPPTSPALASVLTDLAGLYREVGRGDEAVPLLRRVVEIQEAAFGSGDSRVALALNNLGMGLFTVGSYDEAESQLRRALAMQEERPPASPLETARTLSSLAAVQNRRGRLEEAESLMRQAAPIYEAVLGPESAGYAQALRDLGAIAARRGRMDEGLEYLERALDVQEAAVGPDHPSNADILSVVAVIRYQTGRLDGALDAAGRARALVLRHFGSTHPGLRQPLAVIGEVSRVRGDLEAAAGAAEESLELTRALNGPDHPLVADGMVALATVRRDQGRLAEAESLLRRALELREALFGTDHVDVIAVRTELNEVLREAGK